ncbi:hypothetical protein [Nonomuraea dietziae]|uniref:Uncharacterized protein n=1 Tax=Nonomuraea dietziae TaxID=65515 RepID=A0A7W5VSZ1_9ACTN|nr:hypothetical protein [Nonomuraea dietziae]MBB3733937.1 hypothetical protein [Nonomuraea dietziae]
MVADTLMGRFIHANEFGDVDTLVALLTDDVYASLPPIPLEYQDRDVVALIFACIFNSCGRADLVPTRANGQPAFGPPFVPPPACAMEAACSS